MFLTGGAAVLAAGFLRFSVQGGGKAPGPEPDAPPVEPLPDIRAFDPLRGSPGAGNVKPLAWRAPRDRARHAALTALLDFARKGSGDPAHGAFLPFSFIEISGPAGSGKTRLAMEAAHALHAARIPAAGGPDTWRSWGGRTARRREPAWSAGWLIPPLFDGGATCGADGVPRYLDGWLDSLRAWRPRRPTLLILDGALASEARAAVAVMHAAAREAPYAYPVRLILAGVTPLPAGLYPGGVSGTGAPSSKPVLLDEKSNFDAGDIHFLASATFERDNPLWELSKAEHLAAITSGNPLLIELAFDVLSRMPKGRRAAVTGLTVEHILADHAGRWEEALEKAGVTQRGRQALAAAALASGGLAGRIEAEFHSTGAVPGPDTLRRILAYTGPDGGLPALRPAPVADVFVRSVIAGCGAERQGLARPETEDIMAAAWNANPFGTAASVLRHSTDNGDFGRLMLLDPAADLRVSHKWSGFGETDMARVWALAAMCIPRRAWDAGEFPQTDHVLEAAEAKIARLDPAAAARDLEAFAGAIPVRNGTWIVRGGIAGRLIHAWLSRALEDAEAWQAPGSFGKVLDFDLAWWSVIEAWGAPGTNSHCNALRLAYEHAMESVAGMDKEEFMPRFAALEEKLTRHGWRDRVHAATTLHGLARNIEASGSPISALRLWARSCSFSGDQESCRAAADQVERLAAPFVRDRTLALERARAWRHLARAREMYPDACRAAIIQVERIGAPFTGDKDFVLEEVLAWRALAYAAGKDADTDRQAVDEVERLAPSLAGDRNFEFERTQTWRFLADALSKAPEACRAAVDRVEELAKPFENDRSFVFERAVAWRYLIFALRHDLDACRSAVEVVERLALPYSGDRDFEFERAQAWRFMAEAYGKAPHACRGAVEKLERIAAPFTGDRNFELERAQGWRSVAGAMVNDPDACRAAVERMERLAAPFAAYREFALVRTQGWTRLAYALDKDPAACRAAVDTVEGLAAPFAPAREFALQRAKAWRSLAYALDNDADACNEAVRQVKACAEPFASDREFTLQVIQAWRSLAYARRADPEAFAHTIKPLRDMVMASAGDPEFVAELMEALQFQNVPFSNLYRAFPPSRDEDT